MTNRPYRSTNEKISTYLAAVSVRPTDTLYSLRCSCLLAINSKKRLFFVFEIRQTISALFGLKTVSQLFFFFCWLKTAGKCYSVFF